MREAAKGFAELPDGGRIAYELSGDVRKKDPVLLLRPLGGTLSLWGDVRKQLAAKMPVIAFDYRGLGRSSAAPRRVTTGTLADDVRALLDYLAVPQAHVFGISLGGMVATWLAASTPERVGKLCLASTPASGKAFLRRGLLTSTGFAVCFAKGANSFEACLVKHVLSPGFRKSHPEKVRVLQDLVSAFPTDRFTLFKYALAAGLHDATGVLQSVRVPTLALAGGADHLIGNRAIRLLAERIPGAKLEILSGLGHDLTLEAPQKTAESVATFFR